MDRRRKFLKISLNVLLLSVLVFAHANQNAFAFDPKQFNGEKIDIAVKQPAKISGINFILTLPLGYKLLPEAKPNVKLYTSDGKAIAQMDVHNGINSVGLHKKLKGDKLFAELALYYCKEGEVGMCIFKTVLLVILLDQNLPKNNLRISYDVPLVKE